MPKPRWLNCFKRYMGACRHPETVCQELDAAYYPKPWPRLFQNLRASCATDWVQRYPNHVGARWLGHSPLIAATQYLQTREQHFTDVVAGCSRAVAAHKRAGEGTQKTDPGSVQSCVQSEAVWARSNSHDSSRNTDHAGELQDAASSRKPLQNKIVGDIGLEPMTPSLSSWCSNQLS